jgi:hypothetical protein
VLFTALQQLALQQPSMIGMCTLVSLTEAPLKSAWTCKQERPWKIGKIEHRHH